MCPKVKEDLKIRLGDFPKEKIIKGWEEYFIKTEIPIEKQVAEFEAIIKARVQSFCISLVAPDLERLV